jgi:hypothetical protein
MQVRERKCGFGGRNSQKFLISSLLAGNLVRERLAPDCLLRHAVWVAENSSGVALKIAGNPHNSSTVALKLDWRKCPA